MEPRELLQAVAIDRSHSVPLHHQLYTELRRLIVQEKLKPGSGLPQVGDICKTLGLSTITATRAISELKREGLIVTRRGVGMFVAELPTPVTEVVVGFVAASAAVPGNFLFPLVEGVKAELDEPQRRCVMTYFDEQPPSAQELRDLMHSRRADSLIMFRPKPTVVQAARLLIRDYPAVIVFDRPQGWLGDSVVTVPERALRLILEKSLAAGNRRFAYLGKKDLHEGDVEQSPYRRLLDMMRTVLGEASIDPQVRLLERQPVRSDLASPPDRILGAHAVGLAPETLVIADTPHVAAEALAANPRLTLVTYTEADQSVDRFRDRMTLLYCGLDQAGAAAARLLRERLANLQLPPRTIEVEARIVGPIDWTTAREAKP